MSILIFGDNFSFPEGDASTNRVYTYAEGLKENGIKVHVICFANHFITDGDGESGGISYYNPFGQSKKSKYFIVRRWQKFIKYFRTILLVRRVRKKERISAIIVYTMRLSTHLFAWGLSKASNALLIKECSEHPLIHYQGGALKRIQGLVKLNIESGFCSGIFCISRFLVDFHRSHGVAERKLFLVPSTVDPGRFKLNGEKPLSYPYIGYFGGLTFYRDNIDALISSFAVISKKHPHIHLVLGGFCSEKEKMQIRDLIEDLELSSRVNLLKYLPRSEIVRYITHSDILVMVRSKDLETQASFPSKLTEYLATSKPLITVKVGEISDYLTDGVNAFLIEPGNTGMLTEKLEYVLSNYETALQVAMRGKQLADTTFNYNFQAKRMIQYIKTL